MNSPKPLPQSRRGPRSRKSAIAIFPVAGKAANAVHRKADEADDILGEHARRAHHVRSILWSIFAVVEQAFETRSPSATLLFEVKTLANCGVQLADDLIDAMSVELAE